MRLAALIVGVGFLGFGVLGFVSPVTAEQPTVPGPILFGLFSAGVVHNVIHLLIGTLGLLASRRVNHARIFLVGAGLVLGLLWLLTYVVNRKTAADALAFTNADYRLHFGLAAVMMVLGLLLGFGRLSRSTRDADNKASAPPGSPMR
ncbi:DUF4383 domain-containing protein [Mycobacterium sp. IDR2000157661]|uniref:DUF4383 domain-containing protein n=1 Tax=Mycobacterium sp. IDR2000157661 TaxID=2867005 RepID=UPI001EECC795|nr:DUF4383 domain-containing protein [Mycobacterium sp. IDR2000157661]ULE31612.1 DUF4383 domain-containing protein [Mycobacterium sp. IDR2000157661]